MRDRLIETIREFVDYLLKKGVIVPPRKIGDSIYYYSDYGYIGNMAINKIQITAGRDDVYIYLGNGRKELIVSFSDIYPTREEAEAALKGR